MQGHLPDYAEIEDSIVRDQLTAGMRQSIAARFEQILGAAAADWEKRFAGADPSDACVSVRITTGPARQNGTAGGGVLTKPARGKFSGSALRRLA
jgi:hypothetical protein